MNFQDDERKVSHPLIELRTKPSSLLVFSSLNPIALEMFNDNSFPIIFKLKTTEPDILIAQPARGFIPSHSSIHCLLTPLQSKSPSISLVIQYAEIVHPSTDYFHQWKRLKSEKILLKKFQCFFDQSSSGKGTLIKPMLMTFATITLLTTLIYWRNK